MNISETRLPQDGRILFDMGKRKVDLRVSTFPTVHGETIVCRVLDKQNLIVGLDKLGMTHGDPDAVPAGHRAAARHRPGDRPHRFGQDHHALLGAHVPEQAGHQDHHARGPGGVRAAGRSTRRQIHTAKGFTFAKGLRAILRQDPDILLVGEIRDVETAEMAIRAALTGHLVFSTLHTNSAVGAIPRLLDMGIEPFLLSATLVAVVAQRLVRTRSARLRPPVQPEPDDLALMGLTEADLAGPTCAPAAVARCAARRASAAASPCSST